MEQPTAIPSGRGVGYLLLGSLLASVLLLSLAMYEIVRDRERTLDEGRRTVRNIVSLMAAHTRQSLHAVDQSLLGLAATIQPDALDSPLARARANAALGERRRMIRDAYAVFLLDEDGRLLLSSRIPDPEPVDLSFREYYRVHLDMGQPASYYSRAVLGTVGRSEGNWMLTASRALRRIDGSLAGVVAVALEVDHLVDLYGSIDIGPAGTMAVFREDGYLVARHPPGAGGIGERYASDVLFGPDRGDEPDFTADLAGDGVRRIAAYRRLPDHPFIVYVGLAEDDVLAPWRHHSLQMAGVATILSLLLLATGLMAHRRIAARNRDAARYAEALQRLTAASRSIIRQPDVPSLLETVTELSRELVGAKQCVASRTTDLNYAQAVSHVSLADEYAAWRGYEETPDGSGIYAEVCRTNRPMRLSQKELEAHPAWRGFGGARDRHPPMRGWLAVPLVAANGGNLGLIQLSDKSGGEFTATDEAIIVQVANIAAVALENIETATHRQRALEAEHRAREEAEVLRTQAEAAEAGEAATRRWLEMILESIADAFYVLDRDWRCTYANDKARDMIGVDLIEGRTLWEIRPFLRKTPVYENFHAAVRDGKPVDFTYYNPQLENWFEVHCFPFAEGLTVYFRIVTDEVEMEAQLRQAQKLEAVGQITGGVAHDFNNLLTVILGNADIILAESAGNPTLERAAGLSVAAAERASDLTQRLLAFARRQPLEPCAVSVNELVRDMEGLLRRPLGEQIDVELVTGAGVWNAYVDATQLETAILNLCINARDAMPDGGRLTIETANAAIDAEYADAHSEVYPGQYVMVAISDTGTGMPHDVVERAFDPFFTTKAQGRGSGLGLSMVYGFVKQTGGHVKIYSEPGQGTTIRMYLPRAPQSAAPPERTRPAGEPLGDGERVLVVEDEELVRDFFVSTLAALGYEVRAVADGAAALTEVRDGGPFDVLLTDVVLPGGMNGREVAERVQAIHPGIAILYTSGYTENAIVHQGRLDPGVNLLAKPFRKQDVARMMRRTIDRRQDGDGDGARS